MKKSIAFFSCIIITTSIFAQSVAHVVAGSFTEKVIAEVSLNKYADKKFIRIASFNITPASGNFAFITPEDTGTYRLHISLYKPGGRHAKLDKTFSLPVSFAVNTDYTLKITLSKIDTVKKTGWTLSRKTNSSNYVLVRGKVLNSAVDLPITLNTVSRGSMISSGSFSSDKLTGFVIPVNVTKPGFYYLQTPRWKIRVFLSPKENVDLDIDNKTGSVSSERGSPINQRLFEWQQLIEPITRYGYSLSLFNIDTIKLDTYINEYKKLQPLMDEYISHIDKTGLNTPNTVINAMELDREMIPLRLLLHLSVQGIKGYRPAPKDFKEVPDFYKQFIETELLNNTSILSLGEAREYMSLHAKLNIAALSKEEREKVSQRDRIALMLNSISNDTLKSLFLNDQLGNVVINNLSEFKADIEPFKKYAKSGPAKESYDAIYNLFSSDTAFIGKSSYNFTLPDVNGKLVSMKDFKGKVVFIDVWATWCGPCKAQVPFLRQIEEEYKDNQNIVFAAISVDREKDKQKWVDHVKKENYQGVQLLDADFKQFATKYGISAIPRFMLIDKQGKWIEVRCPLPEDKASLKRYLDRALQENTVIANN